MTTDTAAFAVVDDSPSTLLMWRFKSRDKAEVFTFNDPAYFWQRAQAESGFLDKLVCVVTDYHFAEGSAINGMEFAAELRAAGFRRPIFLSSNTDIPTLAPGSGIDKIIPKDPLEFDELRKFFSSEC